MKRTPTKHGFSLMEVMFAVAILATGLVFVACQFPVGLVTCKAVLDDTSHGINVHNAQTMLELENNLFGLNFDARPYSLMFGFIDPGRVHLMLKPNVLADSFYTTGAWTLIHDDLEFTYLLGGLPTNPADLFDLKDYGGIKFPFWTEGPLFKTTVTYLSDVGNMVLPVVDETDPVVESAMRQYRILNSLLPTDLTYQQELNRVICNEALKRHYSWTSMYFQGDPLTQYMITFRNPVKSTRYAVQYPPSFAYQWVGNPDIDPLFDHRPIERPRPVLPQNDSAFWNDADFRFSDRVFPVPWRVALGDITTGHNSTYHVNGCTHFYYDHATGARALNPDGTEVFFPRSFTVDASIGVLLRPGSIIIDADPPDIYWNYEKSLGNVLYDRTYEGCGYIYEVQDVVADLSFDPARYMVTLKTALVNDMVYCWIFPPPIERVGDMYSATWTDVYEFEDQQPVINVTKKRLK
ncbi:MAG: prepilin-type N-terminal cleavage/methylation domain-containing protein [Planctomycetes bacterium]|nr:prepilin-type N-terminal cleavage/methylation domain-containing protein [Planctomycetota bacterium]